MKSKIHRGVTRGMYSYMGWTLHNSRRCHPYSVMNCTPWSCTRQQPYMSQPSISCLVERILGRREKKISGFPHSSAGKESACNAGDLGSIPGSGRSPGVGNGNPLQNPCLENPMDRGAWQAAVHGVTKSQT